MTHLLDTTALLAFILNEVGADEVQELFEDGRNQVAVSGLTKIEFWTRLKSLGREAIFESEWNLYRSMFTAVCEVDENVIDSAIRLRRMCPDRLPTIDALIAATAGIHGMVLVHRDVHMRAIPGSEVRQLDLAATV